MEYRKDLARQRVIGYLREHPTATYRDLCEAGHARDMDMGYGNRINAARTEAGIDRRALITAQRRQRVLDYLRINPRATTGDFVRDGLGHDLKYGYGGRINDARRDVGISKPTGINDDMKRKRLIAYLAEHPEASKRTLPAPYSTYLHEAYGNRMNDVRKEAGFFGSGFIPAGEAARRMGVTQSYLSKLIARGKLGSTKLGRNVFVSSSDVDGWKRQRVRQ